jgi:hypothetical protein
LTPLLYIKACEKIVPYALGFVAFLLLIFAIYVKSVPAVTSRPATKSSIPPTFNDQAKAGEQAQQSDEAIPDFLKVNPEGNSEEIPDFLKVNPEGDGTPEAEAPSTEL